MKIGQLSIWDLLSAEKEYFKITKPIRLIELFAGIGSQAMALRDIGAKFEHYRAVEFDKYAIASYNAIHGTDFPTMDVTKITGDDLGIVDKHLYTYLLTYSFPCTDLSVAGKMCGMKYEDWKNGNATRSGLLWEVQRLLEETKELPQILMMENVPQVHSKSNMDDFKRWLTYLESKGYTNYWKDMNAKDYGVAQSRNRTIMISLLGNYNFEFPGTVPLEKRMKDYLEETVEDKYYLKSDKAKELIDKLVDGGKIKPGKEGVDLCCRQAELVDISNCIPARYDAGIINHKYEHSGVVECEKIGNVYDNEKFTGGNFGGNLWNTENLSPALKTGASASQQFITEIKALDEQNGIVREETFGTLTTDGSTPKHNNRVIEIDHVTVMIKQATKDGYIPCEVGGVADLSYPNSQTRRGRVIDKGRVSPTLTTENIPSVIERWIWEIEGIKYLIRIRKLTPKECWRLMGFTDEDFEKAQAVNSNTQLYKQAGNSIVKDVLMAVFRQLL